MIVEPTITELLELVDDRYELITVASRRARQLASGGEKLVDTDEKSPVTVAALEISEGKVKKLC